MSTLQIYFWLVSVCWLWSFGTWFSWSVNDPTVEKYSYWNHFITAGIASTGCSLFLILGLWVVYTGTKDAKYGWSLRYPK